MLYIPRLCVSLVSEAMDPVDLLSTCHPSPSLTTFAFRSWEVKRLLLDLNSYGGTKMYRLGGELNRVVC